MNFPELGLRFGFGGFGDLILFLVGCELGLGIRPFSGTWWF